MMILRILLLFSAFVILPVDTAHSQWWWQQNSSKLVNRIRSSIVTVMTYDDRETPIMQGTGLLSLIGRAFL